MLAPARLPRTNRHGLIRGVLPGLIGPVPGITGRPLPRSAVRAPAQDGVAEFRESVYLVRESEVILFERPDVAPVGAQTLCHRSFSRLFSGLGKPRGPRGQLTWCAWRGNADSRTRATSLQLREIVQRDLGPNCGRIGSVFAGTLDQPLHYGFLPGHFGRGMRADLLGATSQPGSSCCSRPSRRCGKKPSPWWLRASASPPPGTG